MDFESSGEDIGVGNEPGEGDQKIPAGKGATLQNRLRDALGCALTGTRFGE